PDGRPTDYFMRLLRGQTGELAKATDELFELTGDLETDVANLATNKADKSTTIGAGFGLSGGGDLSANRTLALGDPALADPGADRALFWDDSEGKLDWLEFGSGLSLTGTTL